MIKTYQARPNVTNGDCLDACLSSLLEVPLDQIPPLGMEADNAKWWEGVQNFLRNHGFQLLMMTLTESTPWHSMPHSPWCILVGPTKKNHLHAVVGRTDFHADDAPGKSAFVMIHDPLDGAGGEITVSHVCFLVPINPWRCKREPMIKEIEIEARRPIIGKEASARNPHRKVYTLSTVTIGGGHGEGPVTDYPIRRTFATRKLAQDYIDSHPKECSGWLSREIIETVLEEEDGQAE